MRFESGHISIRRLSPTSSIAGTGHLARLGFFVLLLHWGSLGASELRAQPLDDHLVVLEGNEIQIPVVWILANDPLSSYSVLGGGWLPEVTQSPNQGTLTWSADGSTLIYQDTSGGTLPYVGRDRFRYRLTGLGAPVGEATVTVDIRPVGAPVVGRWFGEGAPLARGLYLSGTAVFRLCHSLEGYTCFDLPVAPEHRLWAPLSADLDGDGIDELMLHDATSGTLVTFGLSLGCEGTGELCLQEIERRTFGQPGELAMVGMTYDGAARFGLFEPTSGRWWLEGIGKYSLPSTFIFDPSSGAGVPLFSDWSSGGNVTPAIFDPSSSLLYLPDSPQGESWNTHDYSSWMVPGEPFVPTSGRPTAEVDCPQLMLFERDSPVIHLFSVYLCDGGQVYSSVPTDPSG